MQPYLLPINEAAKTLGIGRTKLYELISAGEVDLLKIGSKSLVTTASIQALVARLGEVKSDDR